MTISRKPWERRLEDLAYIVRACGDSYFIPDLFRRNTNNFLQTARTVTFIIQKNKKDIPKFDQWYKINVLDKWTLDEIMTWAKNARNIIEKEGDLEINSTLNVSLIFSYLEEEDFTISCGREELLKAGIQKLINLSINQLPKGVSDAAGIRIERCWKTTKLTSYELLQALLYIYSRLYDCCYALARHMQRSIPKSIPDPSSVATYGYSSKQVEYIKIKDLKTYRNKFFRIPKMENEFPNDYKEHLSTLSKLLVKPTDFTSTIEFYSKSATSVFKLWGNHINLVILLDHNWFPVFTISPILEDQTDKYFFWRMLSERVLIQKVHCLVTINEAWIRDISSYSPKFPISTLPIKGECLQVILIDSTGNHIQLSWDILRNTKNEKPTLGNREEFDLLQSKPSFLVPSMKSMGLDIDFMY